MGNVLPISPQTGDLGSDVRHFSIGSKWLYEEDSRLDATSYAEGAFLILEEIETCNFPKDSFGNLCGTIWHPVQNQARSNFKRIYTKPEHGVPFVSSRNMFFLPQRPEKFLSRRMKKLGDLMVPEGWILLSRSGTVGNVLFINKTLSKCAITDHAIRIEPTQAPAGYLYAFLASRFGQALIAKGTYGSTVDELEPKHIAGIPVPKISESAQLSIHNKIIRVYALRDEANELFNRADADLHILLGVSPFTEDDIEYLGTENEPRAFSVSSLELLRISSSNELGVRLDSKHHVPVVRSVLHKLEQGSYPLKRLGDTDTAITRPPRFKRVYVAKEQGIPFFQPYYIPLFRPLQYQYLSPIANANIIAQCILKEGEIIMSRSGTAARACLVTKKLSEWVGSDDLIRIAPKDFYDSGFLTAFFLTPFARHQILAQVYGGVIDHIDEAHVADLLCPDVPWKEQQRIGELVRRAFQKKDEANDLEDEAIAELENLISGSANE